MKRKSKTAATKQSTAVLNDLIEVARDGERFYIDAASKVGNTELKGLFRQMAEVRQQLIDALGDHVLARGDLPSGGTTVAGTLRKMYADALAAFRDDDPVYVSELEEAEDRMLDHYRKALNEAPTDEVHTVLEQHLPTVEAAHLRMKRIKDVYSESPRA